MAIAKILIEEEFATVMLDSKSKLDTGSELTSPVFLSLNRAISPVVYFINDYYDSYLMNRCHVHFFCL